MKTKNLLAQLFFNKKWCSYLEYNLIALVAEATLQN
jgi:hypothetical protein